MRWTFQKITRTEWRYRNIFTLIENYTKYFAVLREMLGRQSWHGTSINNKKKLFTTWVKNCVCSWWTTLCKRATYCDWWKAQTRRATCKRATMRSTDANTKAVCAFSRDFSQPLISFLLKQWQMMTAKAHSACICAAKRRRRWCSEKSSCTSSG